MGNFQFLSGNKITEFPQNNELSFVQTDSEKDASFECSSQTPMPFTIKVTCEYCQEQNYAEFYEQHKRICLFNPDNLRLYLDTTLLENIQQIQQAPKLELEKILCEFCGEPCYTEFHKNHQRVCTKNPENIKINCRYCNRTLNLILYQSHLSDCEESHQQRRRSIAPSSKRGEKDSIGFLGLRKFNTCPEITLEKKDKKDSVCQEKKECSICLEGIKSNFDMSTLTCGHKYHRTCIDNWSVRQRKCPICRKEFL